MKSSTISILCSSQMLIHLLLVLVSSVISRSVRVSSLGNETDRIALSRFRENVASDPLGILESWNDSISHCSWFGVTCSNRHLRVASLILEGQKLSGTISPHIGNLSFLKLLDLGNNDFRGTIPPQLGKLFRLQVLALTNNSLGGEMPVNLTSCLNLETLELDGNNLSGKIPPQLGSLSKLKKLAIRANILAGTIPSSLGNLTSLQFFAISTNELEGEIPTELSRLKNLTLFSVGINHLSGIIPTFLFNISSIQVLSMDQNRFNGELPDKGLNLPNLRGAYFGGNQLSGKIPSSFTNASQLQLLGLSFNNFVGPVPSNIGDLSHLWQLNIGANNLGRNSTDDLDFVASLASCKKLEILDITSNHFRGVLSLANFSTRISELYAGDNQIFGEIPETIENLTNLIVLGLELNLFTGSIPSYIGKLQKLQGLGFNQNMLSGRIPSSIGNLTHMSILLLSSNNLEGSIPSSIGKCQNLIRFVADRNNFSGHIPEEILEIPSLSVYLGLSANQLSGSVPESIGKLTTINAVNISHNLLSGEIPVTIGACVSLELLYMQGNFFRGEIPEAMVSLKGLRILDLSQNNLTGKIPRALQNLPYLQYLNISFNDLEGEVPSGGVFGNASAIFLAGNNRLCGGIAELNLPQCPTVGSKKGKTNKLKLPIIISSLLLFAGLVAVLLVLFRKKRSKPKPPSSDFGAEPHIMVSYKSLYDATTGFSSQNLLGHGSFGSVYKGVIEQLERPVAIKVLNLERQGASNSMIAECNALRNIRHRNLVKLITYCSSLDYKGDDFKALIFEFMPNGSLEDWLHSEANQPRRLDMLQRLSIAIDVASALHYLHDLCEVPIIHRDLKPSNILLDDDMVAHVGDFGLAKFLSKSDTAVHSQSSTLGIPGTTGYVAPEYGLGAAASKEGDIYSYGILLLELFSGRRPTNETFADGMTLVGFIKESLPDTVIQVADPSLFTVDGDAAEVAYKEGSEEEIEPAGYKTSINIKMKPHELTCLISVMEIGISCSEDSPRERASLGDVLRKLHRVKDTFPRKAIYPRQAHKY